MSGVGKGTPVVCPTPEAARGYNLYHLNVVAGPDHEWLTWSRGMVGSFAVR